MSERTVRDCDECGEPAIMALTIQGRSYDLCSQQCGFQILQKDFDRQMHPQKTNVIPMAKKAKV